MGCCWSDHGNNIQEAAPAPGGLFRAQSLLSVYSCDGRHVIEGPVVIGSFNIQNFGRKKVQDEDAVDAIVTIVRCHDLIAIQEVSDKSGKSIQHLLDRINQADDGGCQYELELSPRTGKTVAAAEQYAIFYKKHVFEVCIIKSHHKFAYLVNVRGGRHNITPPPLCCKDPRPFNG